MSHYAAEEKAVDVDDKAVSQEEYSPPSSAPHNDEAVVSRLEEEEAIRRNSLTQDKEAQIDAQSALTSDSGIPLPPDGGLHAWLKVFGGFLCYINIWYVCVLLALPHQPAQQSNTASAKPLGASLSPTAPSNPTTARRSSPPLPHLPSPGSAPCKPGCSSSSACYPAHSST